LTITDLTMKGVGVEELRGDDDISKSFKEFYIVGAAES